MKKVMLLSDYEHLYKGALYKDGKIVLRKLSDMTEEERNEYNKLSTSMYRLNKVRGYMKTEATTTKYLLSKRFDLFNLIEEGLAIVKNT